MIKANHNKSATFAEISSILLLVLTLTGLLWSRAILSIVQGLWVLIATVYYKRWFAAPLRDSLLLWAFAPLLLFVFGVYQHASEKSNYDYLLTLSMYPVSAIASRFCYKTLSAKTVFLIWTSFAIVSLIYPAGSFIINFHSAYLIYAQAKTFYVPMDTDHVRYGLFLCSALLFLLAKRVVSYKLQAPLSIIILLFIILLSVRTSWVGAGIIVMMFLWNGFKKTRRKGYRLLVPIMIITLVVVSYFSLSSVKGKIDYMIYDYQSFNPKVYDANFSDGARRSINAAAIKGILDENIANVGWSAVPENLQAAFQKLYPGQQMKYGWPFNQWLFWWMGGGIWTTVLFTVWLLFPIVIAFRKKSGWPIIAWTLVIVASCLVECTLNLQYGVMLHAWVTCLLWVYTENTNKPYISL